MKNYLRSICAILFLSTGLGIPLMSCRSQDSTDVPMPQPPAMPTYPVPKIWSADFEDPSLPGYVIHRGYSDFYTPGDDPTLDIHFYIYSKDKQKFPAGSFEVRSMPLLWRPNVYVGYEADKNGKLKVYNFFRDWKKELELMSNHGYQKAQSAMELTVTQEAVGIADGLIAHFTQFPDNDQPLDPALAQRLKQLIENTVLTFPDVWSE